MKGLSLARLPLVLSAIIGAALLVSGVVLYFLASAAVSDERIARHQLKAQKLAQQVAAKVAFHRLTLVQLARMDQVIIAAQQPKGAETDQLMAQLEAHLPFAWKLRLVPARLQETQPDLMPPIGYADLDLINQSLSKTVAPPAIADEGGTPEARIVLVQPVLAGQGETVIGHLLLAVRFKLVAELVEKLALEQGFMQLQQARKSGDAQVLAGGGDSELAATDGFIALVDGTQWQIAYWPAAGGGSLLIAFAVVGLVLLLVSGGALFFVSRGLSGPISADLATLVVMVRDAKNGDLKRDYPSQAADVFGAIHTLRDELSELKSGKPKKKPPPPVVDDTPDIDLDLD